MNEELLDKYPGPFTDLLKNEMRLSKSNKKINNKTKMASSLPSINLVNPDKDKLVKVNTPNSTKFNNINIIKDSDESSVDTAIPEEDIQKPTKSKSSKSPMSSLPKFDTEEFKFFTNNKKHKPEIKKEMQEESGTESECTDSECTESECSISASDSVSSAGTSDHKKSNKMNKAEKERKKQELLIKLLALEKKGVTLTKHYSLKSPLEEIEFEYETQKRAAEFEASVHFQEKILMAAVTGLEFLNKKFDPINAKLDGWSESVMDNIKDYDEIFRELHEKYQQKSTMPPELRLLVTLVGSGFMFHLTQTLFKSSFSGIGDVLSSNPDIMKNIMGAMGKSMNQQAGISSPPSQPFQASPFIQPMQQQTQVPQSIPQQKPEISGPSINLSNLMNNFNTGPNNPVMQQAPKYNDESDRFSEASSSTDNSDTKMVAVTSLPKRKGKTVGKTIKI
jgi:hypothetical protein